MWTDATNESVCELLFVSVAIFRVDEEGQHEGQHDRNRVQTFVCMCLRKIRPTSNADHIALGSDRLFSGYRDTIMSIASDTLEIKWEGLLFAPRSETMETRPTKPPLLIQHWHGTNSSGYKIERRRNQARRKSHEGQADPFLEPLHDPL